MTAAALAPADCDVVELDVPADPAYVAVVRTAAAGLAARLDLTLDRIEDLRIAVDEACTLLIHRDETGPRGTIRCRFTLEDGALAVRVSGPRVALPDRDGYAWAVLSALVDSLDCGHGTSADGASTDGASTDGATWVRLVVQGQSGAWS
jgi:serine/threonine-protein kinase RsbW